MNLNQSLPPQNEVSIPEDVQFIPHYRKNFQIPQSGVTFPQEIKIPDVTSPKQSIIQFGDSLGIQMPISYNRQSLIDRIAESLRSLGYTQISNNTYTREKEITLQFAGNEKSSFMEDVYLPETVSSNIFNTIGTMIEFVKEYNLNKLIRTGNGRLKSDIARDIKELLNEQEYVINQEGNFIKIGGSVISGGLKINDLITIQEYLEFLQMPNQIQINQCDLMKLNITLNDLAKQRWHSFADFVQHVSQKLDVPLPIVWLAILLVKLPHESNVFYITLLRKIGDIKSYRRTEDRLNAIYESFRQKIQLIPRTYAKLKEAVKGEYELHVSEKHRDIFIELIETYPDMIDIIRDYKNDNNSLTHALIRMYYSETPDTVEQLYTYAVNYPLIIPESPEKATRRQQITSLSRAYLDSLYQIYSNRILETILDMEQNPLELYLTAIAKVKADQLPNLVANFGMVIPEHLLSRDRRRYVLEFIFQYKDIVTRSPNTPPINDIINVQPDNVRSFIDALSKYTDQEIMTYFGYVGGFGNRNLLIREIFRNISEEGFMIYTEINSNAAVNVETTLLTPIKDILKPYLVFGTPFTYRVIELDELIEAFYEPNDNGFKFMKIGGQFDDTYTLSQVSHLQVLLPSMRNMNLQLSEMTDKVLEKIRSGIIRTMKRSREVDAIIRSVKQSSDQEQKIVKDIFYKIFYAGMYMRRWKGPGNRYPMAALSTYSGGDPQPKTILALGEVMELMNELRLINSKMKDQIETIPQIDYQIEADTVRILSTYLFDLIKIVIKGDKCIREASRNIVISANYYIGVIFGETVPNFDPHSVDPIS
jgi:hypothetical protein